MKSLAAIAYALLAVGACSEPKSASTASGEPAASAKAAGPSEPLSVPAATVPMATTSAAAVVAPAAGKVHSAPSSDKTYVVAYTPKPDPVPMNEPFTIEVAVYDGKETARRLTDVTLSVDAAMPEHGHGMNTQPKVTPRGDGRFDVAGMLFHMPGHWELYFDVTRAGVTERAQVDFDLE